MSENNKLKGKNGADLIRGKLIFYEALLTVYALVTLTFAVLFEFHTVYVSGGSIIFSLGMSWQVVLFAAEFITIAVQIISIAVILKGGAQKAVRFLYAAGYTAGAAAVLCVIYLLFKQGFELIPLVPFSIYAFLICTVRMWIIPRTVKKNIK